MEDNESGYEAGSEKTLPSSSIEISLSDCKKKKPCEICGSDANENLLMTCFSCRVTREHIYCVKKFTDYFVPAYWICDDCGSSSRVAKPDVVEDSNETANPRPNHVDNEDSVETSSAPSRITADRVDNHNAYSEIFSATTNQPSPSQAHTSPVASSPAREQKQSDPDMPSDSESAN